MTNAEGKKHAQAFRRGGAAVVVCATFATGVAAAGEMISKESLIKLDTQALYSTVVKPGDVDPKITRLDDFTVSVENGVDKDVVSFGKQTRHPATHIIDLEAMRGPIQFGN